MNTQVGWWFAPLVVAVVVIIETLFGALLSQIAPMPILLVGILTGATLSVLAAFVLSRLGWWRAAGIIAPVGLKQVLWFVPFFVYGLLPLMAGVRATPGAFLIGIVFAALISFWKLAALALIFQALLLRGRWSAAALAALLYGAMHLGGLLVGGALLPTLLLALLYLLLAWAFLAVRLRTGALWPAMLANTLLLTSAVATQVGDAPNLAPSVESILPAVIISAMLALYGLFVLAPRRAVVRQVVSRA